MGGRHFQEQPEQTSTGNKDYLEKIETWKVLTITAKKWVKPETCKNVRNTENMIVFKGTVQPEKRGVKTGIKQTYLTSFTIAHFLC
jgi:hypothetical protein